VPKMFSKFGIILVIFGNPLAEIRCNLSHVGEVVLKFGDAEFLDNTR